MHGCGKALEKTAMLPEFSSKRNFVALAGECATKADQLRAATVVA